jgi:surface antigen
VLAWDDRQARRRSLYSGTAALRLSRRFCWLAAFAAVLGALGCAGCSYQLDPMVSKPDTDGDVTGSISRFAGGHAEHPAASVQPSETDLAYARATAADALSRGAKDNNVPWQNPQTGVGGNITPLAASYNEDGVPCRDFLASYGRGGSQAWLQGSACRTDGGGWEVKSLKPLKSG